MAGFAAGVGAMIAGIFGMNLKSRYMKWKILLFT